MKKSNGAVVGVVRSAQEWGGIVEEWRCSQQTTRSFCRAHGLAVKTFQWWRWALKSRVRRSHGHPACQLDKPSSSPMSAVVQTVQAGVPAFIEVAQRTAKPSAGRRASGVEVVVAGVLAEWRVRVDANFDAVTLRRVVSLLEEV